MLHDLEMPVGPTHRYGGSGVIDVLTIRVDLVFTNNLVLM
jgi:hypothetical protein